ncbi:Fis family transcriptional regulator [Hymenobacter sedentarius]|uniref:Fis family transcriptional regulator n=1 Tax=Hymenobacter sedentarius TaxID=1411621 RepID=A0A0U4A9H7_9BACT|nr:MULTISPECIES: response regulator [Hymenobacter]ALW84812.1 Fis family transcriptional regulator [Hymenobacter sedentarius]MCC3151762.1 response regulator [Hymenobacter sp. BT770]MDO3413616.1 response regulator [Hymenobacter sp. BT770]
MQILVVDDETDVRDLFLQRFRREIRSGEFNFSFAFSGEEAMQFMRKHHSEVLIILSDINMPGMSGLELLGHVKEEFDMPPTTMMMITAYGDNDIFKQAMELGANDLLTKPVDFVVLKEKLLQLLP